MSRSTPKEQPTYVESHHRSLSPQDSANPKRDGIVSMTGGFSLFPDKSEDQLSLSDKHSDATLGGVRDPAQIEAALDALNKPRDEASSPAYGTPGDRRDAGSRTMSPEEGRRRTQYFQDQFAYKDGYVASARDRIQKDSPVIAELRTNVIVKDEFTLVTDMSYHLSTRFARPESSIMINIDHSACLLLAGSFEPAYILTVSALPYQIQPTTNKRNAALIQSFMADILSVPPERGILRFVPIPEENLASNGTTVFGDIERIEKSQAEENGVSHTSIRRSFARGSRKSVASAKRHTLDPESIPEHAVGNSFLDRLPPQPGVHDGALREKRKSTSTEDKRNGVGAEEKKQSIGAEEKRKSMGAEEKRKSTTADRRKSSAPTRIDSKRGTQAFDQMPTLPPIPKDTPQSQKVSKRKSFLAVFKKL